MIILENVKKNKIIKPTSMKINDGQHIVITGKNGTGKTTFIRMLAGICIPDSGIMIYGNDSFKFPLKLLLYGHLFRIVQKNIFYAEGHSLLYENFSIVQNLTYYIGLDEYNTSEIENTLELLEITEPLEKPISKLSLGTKQKIVAVLALLSTKEFIILDEPTLGMDDDVSHKFIQKILKSNKTIIISTHEKEFFSLFDSRYDCSEENITEVVNNIAQSPFITD
ncbi:ATP-binding cassette domain-containing protein [Clostridium sp. Marseille-P2415]|uniref:ATP-binding cassette domain-containing protein n=1 Tax=Clostridium sp. Marseille-P2415 TaxID=1805471 RepID=UPI0009885A27|nr:ATP-binding cassette domain-containing protein [Clostridium sp. Marseille-P2415]